MSLAAVLSGPRDPASLAFDRRKPEFLATLSHELRTPLNTVIGLSGALLIKAREPGLVQGLGLIRTAGEGLAQIIEDLLDVAAHEAGQTDFASEAFDLGLIADELAAHYGLLAREKGLAFEFEVDPEAEGGRIGDARRVRQVFSNLLSNALKFTARGSIRACLQAGDAGISFSVADTGSGIPDAARGKIFDRFTQADNSQTRAFGGLGLGLALVREVSDKLGGAIHFDSREGVGSIFVVDLPLPSSAGPEASAAPADRPELRVMIVDDNPSNRAVAEALLAPFGVAAVSYTCGAEAIEAWRRAHWDLILMDIQMPLMDGVTATGEIRRLEEIEGRRHTPIVAFTANSQADESRAYRAAGMDDVLEKPVRLPSLIAILDHHCVGGGGQAHPRA